MVLPNVWLMTAAPPAVDDPVGARARAGVQGTIDDLGTPLHAVTFVVVDLETTGGSAAACAITEIGAVKVCGGEVLGEFQTLVHPGTPIPAFIAVLTGITDAMVAGAPPAAAVLPAFFEFLGDAVLVAHNAPFDIGFLKAACAAASRDWPAPTVLDTARLARQVLTRDDTPDCKLSSLARLFHAGTVPNHRALSDARATVDVLHGLIGRLGSHGVQSLEELATFSAKVTPAQRRKRHLAEGLPTTPGVYVFRDGQGQPLYVGTSGNLRARVRTYFTASETRPRMAEMVGLAESITPIVCATALEAQVRELRLIAEHKPRYNRRSRFPERVIWIKLTVEAFPRLSLVRVLRPDGATYLGPFSSRRAADQAVAAVQEAIPIRACNARLSTRRRTVSACVLAEMGRCGAPCEGRESVQDYARHVAAVRAAMSADARELVRTLAARVERLAGAERFEDAAAVRDRLAAFVRAAARMQRLAALTGCPEVVAARPTGDLGWEIIVVRRGRLAGMAVVARGLDPRAAVQALRATAEDVPPGPGPVPAASAAETECVLRWLEEPGVRLVHLEGIWASPCHGAGGHREWGEAAHRARVALAPFADRRSLRPVERPVAAANE